MKMYMKKVYLEARSRPRGTTENCNEVKRNNQANSSNENARRNEVITKKEIQSFLCNCNPYRKNLGSWLFKVLVILFIITMASKIYLLNSFHELYIREKEFIFPLMVINETRRTSLEERHQNFTSTKKLMPQNIQVCFFFSSIAFFNLILEFLLI